jgi:hypothetical protein
MLGKLCGLLSLFVLGLTAPGQDSGRSCLSIRLDTPFR